MHREYLEEQGNAIIDYELTASGGTQQCVSSLYLHYIADYTEDFRRVVQAAKAHGSLFIGQLSHAGRQTPLDVNPNPVSASDVHLAVGYVLTRE